MVVVLQCNSQLRHIAFTLVYLQTITLGRKAKPTSTRTRWQLLLRLTLPGKVRTLRTSASAYSIQSFSRRLVAIQRPRLSALVSPRIHRCCVNRHHRFVLKLEDRTYHGVPGSREETMFSYCTRVVSVSFYLREHKDPNTLAVYLQ